MCYHFVPFLTLSVCNTLLNLYVIFNDPFATFIQFMVMAYLVSTVYGDRSLPYMKYCSNK